MGRDWVPFPLLFTKIITEQWQLIKDFYTTRQKLDS